MSFEQVMPPYNASDPTATFVGSSCFDFLLIELVPMAYRIANELEAVSQDGHPVQVAKEEHGTVGPADTTSQSQSLATGPAASSQNGPIAASGKHSASAGRGGKSLDEEEEREAVFYRLETLGYRVGQGLVERFAKDRPRFSDALDVIKFVCKDLWTLVFRKQVDNLKTNHRGVYVLSDNSFRPFSRMSTEAGGQAVLRAQPVRILLANAGAK
jgi:trafficking protein particle complex subunit 6